MRPPLPGRDVIRRRIHAHLAIEELAEMATTGANIRSHNAEVKDRVVQKLEERLPRVLHDLALEALREWEGANDIDIVRVRFPSGGQLWTYRCPGAQVGDLVVVPPTPYSSHEQYVPVVALGRDSWKGPVKVARLARSAVPDAIGAPARVVARQPKPELSMREWAERHFGNTGKFDEYGSIG